MRYRCVAGFAIQPFPSCRLWHTSNWYAVLPTDLERFLKERRLSVEAQSCLLADKNAFAPGAQGAWTGRLALKDRVTKTKNEKQLRSQNLLAGVNAYIQQKKAGDTDLRIWLASTRYF